MANMALLKCDFSANVSDPQVIIYRQLRMTCILYCYEGTAILYLKKSIFSDVRFRDTASCCMVIFMTLQVGKKN